MGRATAAVRPAKKPRGDVVLPAMKDLWAKSHLAVMRWQEFAEHPECPILRAKVTEQMAQLRAAAKLAEPVMQTPA